MNTTNKVTPWPEDPLLGEKFNLLDFVESVQFGSFVNDDGSGYYGDKTGYYRDLPAIPSEIAKGNINSDYPFVAWFNK